MRGLISLLVFWGFLSYISADVAFTWPYAGAVLGSGDAMLWWKEDGDALLIREMDSHLLLLFTGSNKDMTILNEWVVPTGTYNTPIHLNSNIGPNANNSYFFGIQSNPVNTSGYSSNPIPVLTNFSPRFSLTNMTGKDFSLSIRAENSICNTTDGPDSIIRYESQNQVSLTMDKVQSLSSAQMTTSGAIYNPVDAVIVTTILLTPLTSPTTLPSTPSRIILSNPAPTISYHAVTETSIENKIFKSAAENLPRREVGFLALGPDSTNNNHYADIKTPVGTTYTNHLYPSASTIKTITTESSGIPSSSALSFAFYRERECGLSPFDFKAPVQKEIKAPIPPLSPSPTALRGTVKLITISRSNSLLRSSSGSVGMSQVFSYYPTRESSLPRREMDGFTFSNSGKAYQTPYYHTSSSSYRSPQVSFPSPPALVSSAVSQSKCFRSPIERTDESAAVKEAELRIRGLLGGSGGIGRDVVMSPVSPVSPNSR